MLTAFDLDVAGRCVTALAIDDPAFFKVVGRHFDAYLIADHRPDATTSHPARSVGDNLEIIFEQDAKAPVGQDFIDTPLKNEKLFFRHAVQAD